MPIYEQFAGGAANSTKTLLPLLTGATLLGGMGFRALRTVPTGHMGVVTVWNLAERPKDRREIRIGRASQQAEIENRGKVLRQRREQGSLYGIVGAGKYKVMPFVQKIETVSIQDRFNENMSVGFTHDDQKFHLVADVLWHVRSDKDYPYRALYGLNDRSKLDNVLMGVTKAGMRTLGIKESPSVFDDSDTYNEKLNALIGESLLNLGCSIKEVLIHDLGQSDYEKQRQGMREHATILLGQQSLNEKPALDLPIQGVPGILHSVPPIPS